MEVGKYRHLLTLIDRIEVIRETYKTATKNQTQVQADDEVFDYAKDKIQDINPRFINGDILDTDINDKFDNIWFSNIGTWESAIYLKKLLDKFSNNLNIDGKILICYLYDTVKDTKYLEEWNPIYDLEKTLNILSDYVTDFISFIGVKGILHQDNDWKDSVLIYKKTK